LCEIEQTIESLPRDRLMPDRDGNACPGVLAIVIKVVILFPKDVRREKL
jgi:hypothetical protein